MKKLLFLLSILLSGCELGDSMSLSPDNETVVKYMEEQTIHADEVFKPGTRWLLLDWGLNPNLIADKPNEILSEEWTFGNGNRLTVYVKDSDYSEEQYKNAHVDFNYTYQRTLYKVRTLIIVYDNYYQRGYTVFHVTKTDVYLKKLDLPTGYVRLRKL